MRFRAVHPEFVSTGMFPDESPQTYSFGEPFSTHPNRREQGMNAVFIFPSPRGDYSQDSQRKRASCFEVRYSAIQVRVVCETNLDWTTRIADHHLDEIDHAAFFLRLLVTLHFAEQNLAIFTRRLSGVNAVPHTSHVF